MFMIAFFFLFRRSSHGTDMLQLFKMFDDFEPMPENEVTFSKKLVKLLVDWGKEGRPPHYLSEWKKFEVDNPR